jgi:hypothetical protein
LQQLLGLAHGIPHEEHDMGDLMCDYRLIGSHMLDEHLAAPMSESIDVPKVKPQDRAAMQPTQVIWIQRDRMI